MMPTLPFHISNSLKTFITAFVFVFIFSCIQQLWTSPLVMLSPLPVKKDVFIASVLPKLQAIPHEQYTLYANRPIIQSVSAAEPYDNAKAYIALDFTSGKVLASKNSNVQLPIASLTKIMTAVVALDLASPQEPFHVSQKAASVIPTKIGVLPGESLTLKELLEAGLMTSANDAIQVIKEGIDEKYHDDIFIKAMNAKAHVIGLTNSHFANPQGFDGNNYSTAEDLARLTHYAINHYPVISDIIQKEYLFLPENSYHKQFDLNNWNGLLGVYPDVQGVKIGNTDDAGKTTIVLSTRENHPVLVVLLNAPGIMERDMWTAALLDSVYSDSYGLQPIHITEAMLQEKYQTWYTHS